MRLFGPPNIERMEKKANVPALMKILTNKKEDKPIRVQAALSLGRLHVAEAIEPIIYMGTYGTYGIYEPLQESLLNMGDPAIQPLIERCARNFSNTFSFAGGCLVRFGAQAVDGLIAAMKLPSTDLRSEIPTVLVKIGAPAFDAVATLLTDSEPRLRARAAWILGKMHDARAIQPLLAALKDNNDQVRREIVEALSVFRSAEALDSLVQCLHDSNFQIRKAAATALKSLGWKPTKDEAGANYWIVFEKYDQCASIGAAAVEALRNATHSASSVDRMDIINALAKIKNPGAIMAIIDSLAPIENLYSPAVEKVHGTAIQALVQIGSPAVPPLVLALNHDNPQLRANAITALGRMRDPRAIEPLVDMLMAESPSSVEKLKEALIAFGSTALEPLVKVFENSSSIDSQRRAVSVFSSLGWQPTEGTAAIRYYLLKREFDRLAQMGEAAARQLAGWLVQPDAELAEAVVKALKAIGSPAVEPVLEILKIPDHEVQMQALNVLDGIADHRVIDPLLHYLESWQEDMLGKACLVLANLGDPRALEPILTRSHKIPAGFKAALIPALSTFKHPLAIEFFISIFEEREERIVSPNGLVFWQRNARRAAADALAKQGDPRAIPVLLPHLTGNDLQLCDHIANALDALGWQPETPDEQVAYLIARNKFDAIAAMEHAAVKPLSAFLLKNTYDLATTVKIIHALRQFNKPEAIPAYLHTLTSGAYSLRKVAAQALVELYHSGQLSEPERVAVLDQRAKIQTRHEDHSYSSDCGSHTDSGIGVSFPL